MKYKPDIHLKFDVQWLFLSKGVFHFYSALSVFSKIINRNAP